MPRPTAPDAIVALADRRAAARRARDWTTADALKAEIEAAGWKVIDTGSMYDLERLHPEDAVVDGVTRYGASASVPSRLDEAPVGTATVVLVAEDDVDAVARAHRSLVAHAPDGTQVVIVANGPSEAVAAALAGLDAADPGPPGIVTEVVWTVARLGRAAALNAGIRRAAAPVVVLLDLAVALEGDVVTPLADALADPTVGVAGPFGLVSEDLSGFEAAPADAGDVDAVDLALLAFRREDVGARGELDEGFATGASLGAWWSFVLRDPFAVADEEDAADDAADADDNEADEADEADGEPDQDDDADEAVAFVDLGDLPSPRRAVVVSGLPVTRPEPDPARDDDPRRDRRAKKAWYRFLKRFASRRDLLVGWSPADEDEGPDVA